MGLFKKIGTLMIVFLLISGSVAMVSASTISNVLLGKTATTNISEIHESIAQDKLTNGTNSSDADRYASQTGQSGALMITVPLGAFYDVNEVRIFERAVAGREYPEKSIKVEVGIYSEWGSIWTTALEETELPIELPTGEVGLSRNDFKFDAVTGDVLRITIGMPNGGSTQYELYEVEAYGVENEEASALNIENVAFKSTIESSIVAQNEQLAIDRLNDGILDTSNNWFATDSGSSSDKLVLTVSLDKTYKIFALGFIERWITRACSDITAIDIGLTTADSVLWKNAVAAAPFNEGSRDGDLVASDFMLGGVCGDKLRITLDRSDKQYQQYQLVEMIILGAEAEAIDYEIDSLSVERDSVEIDSLTVGNADIKVNFPYIINADESGQSALLICGIYDKETNALRFCKAQTVILGQQENVTIPCTIEANWSNCKIRAFLCKNIGSLAAVSALTEWR